MEKKKSRKVWKIILMVIAIILILVIAFIIRKAVIISNLESKVQEYIGSNNYYVKVENIQGSIGETYKKDDKYLTKINVTTQGENRVLMNYCNGETINTYIETDDNKIAILGSNGLPSPIQIVNWLHTDNSLQLIFMSLVSSVKSEEYNGKECYRISNFYSSDILYSENESTAYIDKETGLVVKMTNGTFTDSNGNSTKIVTEYEYSFNTVTDSDLIEPDISQYTIQEAN